VASRFALALLLLCGLTTSSLPAQSADKPFVIRDVRVFDGETIVEHQTVVISGGKIAAVGGPTTAVPPGVEEISGEGRTLLPGLIDAHVHISASMPVEALQQALAFGVTGVVDMWTSPPPPGLRPALSRLKELEAEDRPDLAAVRSAGTGATVAGGHPTQMDGGCPACQVPTLAAPGDADSFVATRVSEGSDFIKIIYDEHEVFGSKLPTLSEAAIAALATAAHARGRLAVAHIGTEQNARGAIAAGVDGLAHLFIGPSVSADFGQLAARRGVFVIPTLSILYWVCGKSDGPGLMQDADAQKHIRPLFRSQLSVPAPASQPSCDGTTLAVRQLAEAGVPLLTGTDAPGPGTAYGASVHRELEHLVNAGLTPAAALAAGTSVPARVFGMIDRGRIRPGLRADLLLVGGDPSNEIRATRNIVAIWKRGVRLQRTPVGLY
jgi:imidazolonepropionase-like amidohydrolase